MPYHRAQADADLDDIDLMILAKDTATGGWVPSREHPQDTVLCISDLRRKP
ncbi:hypothetical protein [Verrucomicrobium spinosum]|uniref:hypothetical protein n=1 Tax=Verrucomicrobium spinosum TaxID=2736 RepID=UPI0012E19CAC|nr:hypothetical protein [Verrucomicrobium spinosum]